jgi:polysaccharide deacetylase family protein (PEP-CTERM system associated)
MSIPVGVDQFPGRIQRPFVRPPASRESSCCSQTRVIFTIDVEDWFHILEIPAVSAISAWEHLPSRVEGNFHRLLDLLSENNARATCFFLGWVGQRFPELVREAFRRGHEIASHGYAHRLVYELTEQEFQQDALRSKCLLEDIAGTEVLGFRSAGFSLTERTPWFFARLAAAGYRYDSSIFPSKRAHGGISGAPQHPYVVDVQGARIIEFPVSVANFGNTAMCFFGGGYLRLSPYWLIRQMAKRVLHNGRPLIFYIHPREIDPAQPRLQMNGVRRFKSYVNLQQTEDKLRRILKEFPVSTFQQVLNQYDSNDLRSIT